MPISINWGTRVIYVPKSYLTLIQASPTEIYEMNLNSFRLDLKDLEDDEEGMTFPNTHNHNTEVSLGGLTYARVIEIINGYTVTFEDGQYAVNLVGANSNVGDVVNVNQVSVRTQNSAGLISSPDVEFSSFNGGVTIDVTSSYSGTLFPNGTERQPVNNLDDAKLIAEFRGLSKLYINGNITFTSIQNIDGFIVVGQNDVKTHITLEAGLSTEGCEFKEATIDGTLNGNTYLRSCHIEDLTYVEGKIRNCILEGTIILAGNRTTNIINCTDGIAGDGKPTIDMGGSGQPLTVNGYTGEIQVVNKNGADKVSIDLVAGAVELDSTVTNGDIYIRGVGTLQDNSTGTANVDWSALISREIYTDRIYVDTTGSLSGDEFPKGTIRYPVDNMIDAKAIADALNIKMFSLIGSITLNQSYSGYKFVSPHLSAGTINLNDQDVTGCIFDSLNLEGNGVGPFRAENTYLITGMTNIQAVLSKCYLEGTFTLAVGQALQLDSCKIRGTSTVFNLNGSGTMSCAELSGVYTVINMTSPLSLFAATGNFVCTLHPTCIDGTVLLSGVGACNNLSSISNIVNKVVPGATWDSLRSSHVETGTFGATDEWASAVDSEAIADAVWDELSVDHNTIGTMGYLQNTGGAGGDPSLIADAVWEESSSDHNNDGTMGELQNKIDELNISKPKVVPGD